VQSPPGGHAQQYHTARARWFAVCTRVFCGPTFAHKFGKFAVEKAKCCLQSRSHTSFLQSQVSNELTTTYTSTSLSPPKHNSPQLDISTTALVLHALKKASPDSPSAACWVLLHLEVRCTPRLWRGNEVGKWRFWGELQH